MSCNDPSRRGRFTVVDGAQLRATLMANLVPCIDQIRDINTQLGRYTYRVLFVRTQWSGGARNEGTEAVISEEVVVPTPKLAPLTGLEWTLNGVGREENGQLQVSELSRAYTEDCLLGTGTPDDQNFYWEVVYPQPDGTEIRRRFLPRGVPSCDPANAQWTLQLVRAHGDRDRVTAELAP